MTASDVGPALAGVFIFEPDGGSWIIRRLMDDIAAELTRRGVEVVVGDMEKYNGEEVLLSARYLTPAHRAAARVNSLFVTHIDDRAREAEFRRGLSRFNSLVCLSPHDARFVAALKGSEDGVVGIDLPPRPSAVTPIRLAYFSARYPDGRKNERWITEYFRARPVTHRASFLFSFLGDDWEEFAPTLARLDLNYEICRLSRKLPGEYDLYKTALARCDALLYLGFDGGAMSVYDALACGLNVIATDISYHRNLAGPVTLVGDRDAFFAAMDELHESVFARAAALEGRSVAHYVDRLISHWQAVAGGMRAGAPIAESEALGVKREFRARYQPLGLSRIRSALIRILQRARWSRER